MSNDAVKREHERSVLTVALAAPITAKNRNILEKFIGPVGGWKDDWQECDRPDLYRVFDSKIVGVEHFAVDKISDFTNGKYQQFTKALHGQGEKIRKKYFQDNQIHDTSIFVGESVGLVSDVMTKATAIGDRNMIPSLCDSVTKHGEKCDEYRENLSKLRPGMDVVLGCLIELTGDFGDVVLIEDGTMKMNDKRILPLSHALFVIFSQALSYGFDFVMFYRSSQSAITNDDVCDRLMVMDVPLEFMDVTRYFQGEMVYGRIPASYARDLEVSGVYGVRKNVKEKTIETLMNMHIGGEGVDLQLYWMFACLALSVWVKHGFCYCDIEMAATVYALDRLGVRFEPCLYRDGNGWTDGWTPIHIDEKQFHDLRIWFLMMYRPKGLPPLSLMREFCKKSINTDVSGGGWKIVERGKPKQKKGGKKCG